MRKLQMLAMVLAMMMSVQVFAQFSPQFSRDTRSFSLLSFEQSLSGYGFEFSGELDIFGNQATNPDDLSGYSIRQRGWFYLHSHNSYGLGIEIGYDDSSGLGNDYGMIGPRAFVNYKGAFLSATYFPYESDQGGQRIGITGSYALADHSKLSLWGDYHFEDFKIISEAELSLQVFRRLWFNIEYRLNRRLDTYGFGMGFSLER